MKNTENPGSFSDELNNLYSKNGLPALNLEGFIPPSMSYLRKLPLATCEPNSVPPHSLNDAIESSFSSEVAGPPSRLASLTPSTPVPAAVSDFDTSVGARLLGGSKLCKPSVSNSASRDQHPHPTDVWQGYKVYKSWGVKLSSTEELQRSWEKGEVVISKDDGSVPDYNAVMSLLSNNVIPKMLILAKDDFKEMASSPKRYLRRNQ